jgi:tetrahydromethanopterin S-methyltransferase subunit F
MGICENTPKAREHCWVGIIAATVTGFAGGVLLSALMTEILGLTCFWR